MPAIQRSMNELPCDVKAERLGCRDRPAYEDSREGDATPGQPLLLLYTSELLGVVQGGGLKGGEAGGDALYDSCREGLKGLVLAALGLHEDAQVV